jgi:hypothetical protein
MLHKTSKDWIAWVGIEKLDFVGSRVPDKTSKCWIACMLDKTALGAILAI